MKSTLLATLFIISITPKAIAQSQTIDCNQPVPIERAGECFSSQSEAKPQTSTDEISNKPLSEDDNNVDDSLQFWLDVAVISLRSCKMLASSNYTSGEVYKHINYSIAELLSLDSGGNGVVTPFHLDLSSHFSKPIFEKNKSAYLKPNGCNSK